MKLKKIFAAVFLTIFFSTISLSVSAKQTGEVIDWEKGVVRVSAQGMGKSSTQNKISRKAQARRAAIILAERELAEKVNGVTVESKITVKDLISKSGNTKIRVSSTLENFKIVREEYSNDDTVCQIDMELPIFGGENSLARAVIPKHSAEKIPFPEPINLKNINGQKKFTGLIIDCRGLNFCPTLLPAIKTKSGRKIYGSENFSYDKIVGEGIAGYASDTKKETRAGRKLLMVKAVRLENNKTVAVITDSAADRILFENKFSKFLDNCAVVFLK